MTSLSPLISTFSPCRWPSQATARSNASSSSALNWTSSCHAVEQATATASIAPWSRAAFAPRRRPCSPCPLTIPPGHFLLTLRRPSPRHPVCHYPSTSASPPSLHNNPHPPPPTPHHP